MARCDYCKSYILFGGRKQDVRTFCNDNCLQEGRLVIAADRIPQHAVDIAIDEVHQGECPKCSGPGPVDVHVAHSVWSALYLTSWKSKPHLCCRSCGRKEQLTGLCFSGLLGWWGFPWGLIMAPVQIVRNISGMFGGPDPDVPSEQLETLVRIDLAERVERGLPLPGRPSRKAAAASAEPAELIASEPIAVECDACGKRFKAKPTMAGKSGKCPGCGSRITVPEPEIDEWVSDDDVWDTGEYDDSAADEYEDYEDDNPYAEGHDDWDERPARRSSARRRGRAPQKSSTSKVIVVLGSLAAGLFLVGLLTAAGMLIFGGNRNAAPPANAPPALARNNPQSGGPDSGFPNANQAGFNPRAGKQASSDLLSGGAALLPDDVSDAATGLAGGTAGVSGASGETASPPDASPSSVKPLPGIDAGGRLWVVLSNLRESPGRTLSAFRRPFLVDYQLASGTPDANSKYVLHVTSTRGSGVMTHYVDIPVDLQPSGTVEFVTPPTFGPGNGFQVTMTLPQGRNKWDELSGNLTVGGTASVAQAPPTIQEVAGAAAQGKLLAIANPSFSTDNSPFPTLTVSFVLQQAAEPAGYYFLVVDQSSGERIEFDVSRSLRQSTVNAEGTLGGRLLGPSAQIRPPFTLHVEKRESRIPSRIRREEPKVVSNRVTLTE